MPVDNTVQYSLFSNKARILSNSKFQFVFPHLPVPLFRMLPAFTPSLPLLPRRTASVTSPLHRVLATMSAETPPVIDKPTLFIKASPDGGIGDCPFSHKANLALRFRRADFAVHPIDLSNKPAWFIDLNESGTTPVLLDGATALGDSDDIVDFADSVGEGVTLTRDDDPNWDIAFDAVSPVFGSLVRLLKAKDDAQLPELKLALEDALKALDQFFNKVPGKFLLGDDVSALDCNLAPKLQHVAIAAKHYRDFDIPAECSAVLAYLTAFRETEEWQASACTDDTIVWGWSKFFK